MPADWQSKVQAIITGTFCFDLTDLASLGITPPITSAVLIDVMFQFLIPSQIWELLTVTTPVVHLAGLDGTAGGINILTI